MRVSLLPSGVLAAVVTLLTTTAAEAPSRAQPARDLVVARVGDRTITVGDVERRMGGLPPFQLRTFGRTPDEIRKNFVEQVMIRELLLSQGAVQRDLMARPDVDERIRNALRSSLLARIRAEVAGEGPPTDEEVRAYYQANLSKFHTPARLALWRILVATREDAEAVLAALRADPKPGPDRWNELARERSLDKATGMRGGNLGFVAPDGSTGEPGVAVDPGLYEAAQRVKDAEIVPEPVREGQRWAVVWRRQSMKAVDRPVEQEAASIRQVLVHAKTEERIKTLLEKLHRELLSEVHPELVEQLDIAATGEIQPVQRPGAMPLPRRAPGAPAPNAGPGGLR